MKRLAAAAVLLALSVAALLLWHGRPPEHSAAETPRPRPTLPAVSEATRADPAAPGPAEKAGAALGNAPRDADVTLVVLVIDENRRPWPEASVEVMYFDNGSSSAGPQAVTDAEGRARLAVRADTGGSVTARVGAQVRWTPLDVTRGKEASTTIVVRSGGRIAGSVRHVTKGPLPGIRVRGEPAQQGGFREWVDTSTDAQGRFLLDPVPPGSWKISVGDLKDYVSVKLGQGGSADMGLIEVGGGMIDGLVRDAATGRLLAGVTVEIRDPTFRETTTDLRGRFRFEDLTPSFYGISLRRRDYGWRQLSDVEVKADAPTEVTVDLTAGAIVHMYARDAEGRAYCGMAQFDYSRGNNCGTTTVFFDERGHAEYRSIVPGPSLLSISASGIDGASESVDLASGENTVRFTVGRRPATPAKGGTSLRGTVRDAKTGAPIPGVRVAAYPGHTYTDERGEYVLADMDLLPGTCRLGAIREGYVDAHPEPFPIAEGEERRMDLSLEPAVTVHVTLKDKDGSPVPGEALTTFCRLPDRQPTVVRAETDDSGRATVRRLVPGRYRMSCCVAGIGESRGEVTIGPDGSDLEIVLR